jgi:2-polyprenyl-6-methoxyphenol hydroxylase-like FAD-dependent oxidoreductase
MKILIAGGGIGGLTTALCLSDAGFEVEVFESAGELKPLGVGINLLPHSVRVLTRLGLQRVLAENSVATSDLSYYNRFGQCYWTEPRGRHAGYKWPQFSIHRGTLQLILWDTVRERVGEQALKLNHHLLNFEQDDRGVRASFVEKETGKPVHVAHGDILIAAEGINSAAREQFYPDEGPPVYSENVLYRGTTTMKPFANGRTMAMIGSMKQKMVVYPISEEANEKGEILVNWVANLKEGKSSLMERDWHRKADKNRLLDLYREWVFDWLDVPGMIAGAETVYEFPMSDRNPLEQWTFNRVTLLGDAAHPMYPIGSNGASQAILDGECLARSLTREAHPIAALKAYERERLPATGRIVLQNRAKGPDEIMELMAERFPEGFSPAEIPRREVHRIMDHYKKIAGFDIKTLNAMDDE